MTVQELIEKLQALPPDLKVVVRGYEEGYNDIQKLTPRKIVPHPGQAADYYGEFIDAADIKDENVPAVDAVELYGVNTKAVF